VRSLVLRVSSPDLTLLLLFGRERLKLQGVDAALDGHLVAQQGIDHAVTGGGHLGLEGVRDDDQSRGREAVSINTLDT